MRLIEVSVDDEILRGSGHYSNEEAVLQESDSRQLLSGCVCSIGLGDGGGVRIKTKKVGFVKLCNPDPPDALVKLSFTI